MSSEHGIRAELKRVVAAVKHHVEEQLELGLVVPSRSRNGSEPTSDSANPVGSPTSPSLFSLETPKKPNPFATLTMGELAVEASGCTRCPLHETRRNVVFGVGDPRAALMFVGEAPGHDEDLQGEPFVGKAGQLLTRIIEAMGLSRQQVYICNVLKCRPPENRNPLPREMETCRPFLFRQIELMQPKVIVALGTFAVRLLLQTEERVSRLRGRFHDYQGIKVMPTYHPAFLLRNPDSKREVWEDMKLVMAELQALSGS